MPTVHNRERRRLVLLALFLVSYHTIVSNQTKKAFIYSRCLLSYLWTRRAKALQVWTKKIQLERLSYAEFNYTLPEKISFISIF
jgi:hypothetical protein